LKDLELKEGHILIAVGLLLKVFDDVFTPSERELVTLNLK
jgi:hypothetical protein